MKRLVLVAALAFGFGWWVSSPSSVPEQRARTALAEARIQAESVLGTNDPARVTSDQVWKELGRLAPRLPSTGDEQVDRDLSIARLGASMGREDVTELAFERITARLSSESRREAAKIATNADPLFPELRHDPSYQKLLRRLGH